MADHETSIAQLKQRVNQFVTERDWKKFHSPKNLSMALSIEVAELMEHFQWIDAGESRQPDENKLEQIKEELSDVLCYTIAIANELEIDISDAFAAKMKKNEIKYPVAEFRGRFGADDPNPVNS